ncbi:MAG: hypothetical protein EOP06_05250 [Proteobacteria bacterium]|nr:MAG: hypothetical protein EOP06_05250 [Pseudomonadota bacterium]
MKSLSFQIAFLDKLQSDLDEKLIGSVYRTSLNAFILLKDEIDQAVKASESSFAGSYLEYLIKSGLSAEGASEVLKQSHSSAKLLKEAYGRLASRQSLNLMPIEENELNREFQFLNGLTTRVALITKAARNHPAMQLPRIESMEEIVRSFLLAGIRHAEGSEDWRALFERASASIPSEKRAVFRKSLSDSMSREGWRFAEEGVTRGFRNKTEILASINTLLKRYLDSEKTKRID